MKNIAHRLLTLLTLAAIITLYSSCSGTKSAVATDATKKAPMKEKMEKPMLDPYAGTWEYEVTDTPNGDVTGDLIITKEGDSYKAKLSSELGEAPINNLSLENNSIKGTFDMQGYEISISGAFDGDALNGEVGVEYTTFPLVAKRKPGM